MSLPKAGEGAANYSVFPVTCVVVVLQFSVTTYVQIWKPERMLAILLTQRRLCTEQGISKADKKFPLLFPRPSTARPAVTSFSVADSRYCNRPICATLPGSLVLRLSLGIIAGFDVRFTGI